MNALVSAATVAVPPGVAVSSSDAVGIEVLDVPADVWLTVGSSLAEAGAVLDWLCATHLVADRTRLPGDPVTSELEVFAAYVRAGERLHVRTVVVPGEALESLTGVFATADWYEREAAQMVGVEFAGGSREALLLPEGFEGFPLRRDFPLTARVSTPWPGAAQGGRRARVPGVNPEWRDG